MAPPRPQGAIADCCLPAPSVMQFDRERPPAARVGRSGGSWQVRRRPGSKCEPNCQWPNTEHGIYVDHKMNVWLGGQAGGAVLKFTANGTFLLQIGRRQPPVRNSNDTNGGINGTPLLAQPADLEVDPETNELYIADGYTNLRVIVVDADTGMYKRHWGAYGQKPVNDTGERGPATSRTSHPRPNFRNPVHAVRITKDGLVYVADRANDRIQVFDKKKVGTVMPEPDRAHRRLRLRRRVLRRARHPGIRVHLGYRRLARPAAEVPLQRRRDEHVRLDAAAQTGEILDRFGRNGRNAGQFHWVHNLAVDSKGNIYTSEVDTGKRVQKFTLKKDDDDASAAAATRTITTGDRPSR